MQGASASPGAGLQNNIQQSIGEPIGKIDGASTTAASNTQTTTASQMSASHEVPLGEVLKILGRKAHGHASSLTRVARAQILQQSARPWNGQIEATVWTREKFDTTGGSVLVDTWNDFGGMMTDYAQRVLAKVEGLWFSPAVSSNGRCRDIDIEAIT